MRPQRDAYVAAALAELEAVDERAADHADAGLSALTLGDGLETITQHGLQAFLWQQLPRRWAADADGQLAVADALARLLDKLGLPRYAEVCRSPETAAVLAAYRRSATAGSKAYREAEQRSGVAPPDLTGPTGGFAWSPVMGLDETRAYQAIAAALELAIAAGDLTPGARGWRAKQREFTHRHLTGPRMDLDGRSWAELIQTERRRAWRRSRGQARRQLLDAVDPLLDDPFDRPDGATAVVEALRWLLAEAEHGLALTQGHRLTLDVVVAAARRFGWHDERFPPRSETDVIELHQLHLLARDLRLVRRRGRRLLVTARGRELLADPGALWQVASTELAAGDGFDAAVAEAALGLLLVEGERKLGVLVDEIGPVVAGEGWRERPSGVPPRPNVISTALWRRLSPAMACGTVTLQEGPSGSTVALTDTGRYAAILALRARATGPARLPR